MADRPPNDLEEEFVKAFKSFMRIKPIVKLSLSAASILMLAAVGVVATHASFHDAGEVTVTGSAHFLFMGNSISGNKRPSLYWTYTDLVSSPKTLPGVPYESSFTVSNSNPFPVEYKMTQSLSANLDVARLIQLTVKKGSTVIYTGTYDNFTMSPRTLSTGESETFSSTVTWPTSAVSAATRGKDLTGNLTIVSTQK